MSDGSSGTSYYTVGSLFAGIGGFCLGFRSAGFTILWGNENDRYAVQTYKLNLPEVRLYTQSIEELSVRRDGLEPVDVLTAGFPCQPFSIAGHKKGFGDQRGSLFFEIIRLLKEFGRDRPKVLVMENVKNLLNHDRGRSFDRVVEEVQSAGYWFSPRNSVVLNTKDHTRIPQNRERLYMVALSWDSFGCNSFVFPDPMSELNEVSTYLDLDRPAASEFYFDRSSKYGRLFEEAISKGNPGSVYLLRRYYVRENKSNSVFTLTANMGEGGHNVPVIRDSWGIRKLTPEECLRLQGFPETFTFPDSVSRNQRYRQIGNAVTVDLVRRIADSCRHLLDEHTR